MRNTISTRSSYENKPPKDDDNEKNMKWKIVQIENGRIWSKCPQCGDTSYSPLTTSVSFKAEKSRCSGCGFPFTKEHIDEVAFIRYSI